MLVILAYFKVVSIFCFVVVELLYSKTVVEKSLGVVFIVMKLKVKSLLFKHSGESFDHEPARSLYLCCVFYKLKLSWKTSF